MYSNDVEFFCLDCKLCEKGGRRSITGRVAKAALTGGLSLATDISRALDSSSCTLCTHKESDHKNKLSEPSFAFTPKGGQFDFEPDDGIAFRAVACVQSASTGGPSLNLDSGQRINLVFLDQGIEFCEVKGGRRLGRIPYEALASLEVGGPGVQSRGGGFAGGGFGLAGFAVGVVTAGVLNKLTTRTSIQTLLRIQAVLANGGVAEWVFLTDVDSPESVAGIIRPITLQLETRVAQQAAQPDQIPSPPQVAVATGGGDKISRLRELAELHQTGVLSDDEFAKLKAEILG